jgi:glycosyltransferase involved in cell wall biosynthesis
VIVTAVGGLPEAVHHGVDGLVVPPAEPAALADAIVELLADPDRARAMGEAGRRRFDRASAPVAIAGETIAVYEQAIAARSGILRSSKI